MKEFSAGVLKEFPWFLVFFPYPLALLIPAGCGFSARFHFTLPVTVILTLWCAGCLLVGGLAIWKTRAHKEITLSFRPNARACIGIVLAVYAALWLVSVILNSGVDFISSVQFLGFAFIPLTFALLPNALISKRIAWFFALLFAIQVFHGTWQFYEGYQTVGTTGNRNWFATLCLALTPWAWYLWLRIYPRKSIQNIPGQPIWHTWLIPALFIGSVSGLSLLMAWHARSKAAWLLLGVYCILLAIFRLPRHLRLKAVTVLTVTAVLGGFIFNSSLEKIFRDPGRIGMWKATSGMIADYPAFGAGPGNYQSVFSNYRAKHAEKLRKEAAVIEHPHNQGLHLAATLGTPAALLWLLLLIPLVIPTPPKFFWQCVHFSAFMLIGHGMLDKTLVQAPGSIIGLICLGLLWRPLIYNKLSLHNMRQLHPATATVLIIALGLFAGVAAYQEGIGSIFFRQGFIKQHQKKFKAAYNNYSQAARIQPARTRAHIFAANLARTKLREPSKALEHFQQVYPREQSFGHINRDMAFTCTALKNHKAAYRFFRREADIFPLNVNAQRNVIRSAIITETYENLEHYAQQLRKSQVKSVTYQLGEDNAIKLAKKFLEVVQDGEKFRANYWAEQLLSPLDVKGPTTLLRKLLQQKVIHFPLRNAQEKMTVFEWQYWQSVGFWSAQRKKMGDARFIPEIIDLARCAPRTLHSAENSRSPLYIPPITRTDRIHNITRILNSSGLNIQYFKVAPEEPPFLLRIRNTNGDTWLWNTASGALRKGSLAESDIASVFPNTVMQKLSQNDKMLVSLPFYPQQFLEHVEALGRILQEFHALKPPRDTERPAIQKLRAIHRLPSQIKYRHGGRIQDVRIHVRLDIPFMRDTIRISE